jgi:Flp pilus assembly protein CpaB
MRSRGLVVAIAVVLAVAAAAAVVLYTQGVKETAERGGNLTPVIVSTQDIPANQPLGPLVDQEVFRELSVPQDALVNNPVTSTDQLRNVTTTQPIFANEQIPLSRLSSAEEKPNLIGISEGHLAVSVEIDAPQGGLGNIQPGDNVTVFATYQGVQAIRGNLKQLIQNASLSTQPRVELPDFTLTLIPTVRVLKIQNPEVDSETGRSDSSRIQVTLDLEPKDAQNLVFAQENARIWLGLLPPEEDGTPQPASTVPLDLLFGAKLK